MDDEKYFGLTPAQLNLAFFVAVGAVALAAFVYFGGAGAVKEYLGEEQVAVVETGTPTPAPTEAPAAVPAQEQEEKPAAESDPPPPQVFEPPVNPPPPPPPPPPKPTPTPEPPMPSVAPYWIQTAASVGVVYVYHPNVDCQLGGGYGPAGWVLCNSPTEGWTLDCAFNRNLTLDCTHSRDGSFTCGGDSGKTTCIGGLTSTCTNATANNPIDLTCSRSDGETLTSPYGESVAEEGGAVFYWSEGSFVCTRVDPSWACS